MLGEGGVLFIVGVLESKYFYMKAIRERQDKSKDSKFIEKIKFEEDFPPFKKWQEVKLWWQKQIQDLIEFYLKSKGVKNYQKNAERFKINCLLGSNGGGKSRIIEYILSSDSWLLKNEDFLNRFNILDDFSKISWTIEESINYNLILANNFSKFYCEIFNFLSRTEKEKIFFSSFLNVDINFQYNLDLTIKKYYGDFGWKYVEFIEPLKEIEDYSKYSINDKIDYEQTYKLFKYFYDSINGNEHPYLNFDSIFTQSDIKNMWLNLWDIFIATINNYWNLDNNNSWRKVIFNNSYYLFIEKLNLILFFIELINETDIDYHFENIWNMNLERCNLVENIKKIKIQIKNLQNYLQFLKKWDEEKAEEIAKIILWWRKKYWKYSYELQQKLNKDQSSYYSEYLFLELIYDFHYSEMYREWKIEDFCIMTFRNLFEMRIKHDIFDKKLHSFKKIIQEKNILTQDEIFLLSFPYFKLDFCINDKDNTKSFNNFSAWEKTILTRFTNIYRAFNISQERNLNEWNTAIVLIDEPDLHLHLDWQRKYIQKLIDVFSTLPEEINIHFIIATHSPFIISDLPWECIVKLQWDWKWNTEISYLKDSEKTFWANYIDLIEDGFFFEDKNLMWSFSENIIWWLAEEERKKFFNWETNYNTLKQNIWDDFLKQNLAYFYKKDNEEN